jgi:alkylation response protein AidB-like acyl-CoA dehydrogenase
MSVEPRLDAFARLEACLGSPHDVHRPSSFARALDADEREALPCEACQAIERWGLPRHFVPEELGGSLTSFDELGWLWLSIARRDLTAAVTQIITFIGAIPVWVAGDAAQQRRTADAILRGDPLSFALTERAHGSDLLASESWARPDSDDFVLSGEKWLIGNGRRSRALTVFARTEERDGPAAFSMFYVEKERLAAGTWQALPRERTLGLRGMDLSGVRFERARLCGDALLGQRGHGLEDVLRAQQIARTVICALSLGALDSALRSAVDFATDRRLYHRKVLDMPHPRATLAEAFATQLACECVLWSALRGMHAAPDQLSLRSAAVKAFVPPRADEAIRRCASVLGARYFLRGDEHFGIFQKIVRDHGVLSIVESSTMVNLSAVAAQLATVSRVRRSDAGDADRARRIRVTFDPAARLPAFDLRALRLLPRGGDDVVAALPAAIDRVEAGDATRETAGRIVALARALMRELELVEACATHERSPNATLAERYVALHAAAACVHAWVERRETGTAFARGAWLVVALNQLLMSLGTPSPDGVQPWLEELADDLRARCRHGRLLATIEADVGW